MRTILHLAAPWSDDEHRVSHSPFDVVYEGDLDLEAVRAAYYGQRPLQIGEHAYLVRAIDFEAMSGATVVEVEVVPAMRREGASEAKPPTSAGG